MQRARGAGFSKAQRDSQSRQLPPAGPVAGAFAVLAAFALFFVGEKRSRRAGDGGDSRDVGFFDISGGDGGGDDGSD